MILPLGMSLTKCDYRRETTHMKKHWIATILLFVACTILLAGCGDPKKNARQELAKMNVEYTVEAFNAAIENKDDQVTKLFLQSGFDVSLKDDNGKTPLMAAASVSNMDVLNNIIQADADCEKDVDNAKHAPLAYAIQKKQGEAVQALKDGSDWSLIDSDGNTLLHLAALAGDADILTETLQHDIDINARNQRGETALFLAAKNGDAAAVNALLEKNADKAIAANDGQTPAKAAQAANHPDVAKLVALPEPKPAAKPSGWQYICTVKAYDYAVDLTSINVTINQQNGRERFVEYWVKIKSTNKASGASRTRDLIFSVHSGKGYSCSYAYDAPGGLKPFDPYTAYEYNREAVTAFNVTWEYLFHEKF